MQPPGVGAQRLGGRGAHAAAGDDAGDGVADEREAGERWRLGGDARALQQEAAEGEAEQREQEERVAARVVGAAVAVLRHVHTRVAQAVRTDDPPPDHHHEHPDHEEDPAEIGKDLVDEEERSAPEAGREHAPHEVVIDREDDRRDEQRGEAPEHQEVREAHIEVVTADGRVLRDDPERRPQPAGQRAQRQRVAAVAAAELPHTQPETEEEGPERERDEHVEAEDHFFREPLVDRPRDLVQTH